MIDVFPKLSKAFSGISGILVTPFDEADSVVPDRLDPIIDRAVVAGVDVLVVNGNTGEFYALDGDEARRMMEAVIVQVDGRVPVINGVGRSVGEACTLARASAAAGVDALMVHQPPDPFVAPRGVLDYVRRVADAAQGLPLMLYLRNDAIGVDTIVRLTQIPGVIGVKWATPAVLKLAAAIRAAPPEVVWVCGLAETWAPSMHAVGARGFTSGLINVWPARSVAIRDALRADDYPEAMRLIGEIEAFESIRAEELNGTNVTGVKAALRLMGNDCGPARPPAAWPLTDDQHARMRSLLAGAGLC